MMGVTRYTGVLSMSIGESGASAFSRPPNGDENEANGETPLPMDPCEVDTADKVVFCGLSDGTFEAFDLNSKLSVFRSSATGMGPLHSIAYSSEHSLLATGSGSGVVRVYDTRSVSSPLVSFQRNSASVEDVAFTSSGGRIGLAIATEDGLPYVAHIRPEGPSVCAELVGPDCDAVRCVRVGSDTNEIWTAGDDGIVRKYTDLNV